MSALSKIIVIGSMIAVPCALSATAQAPASQMHHHDASSAVVPTEPGHAAFAAISEIVATLNADPHTDWSKVDIGSLRDHLLDMDDVIMRASVDQIEIPSGARFEVTGDGPTARSIQRMAMAQARMLQGQGGLSIVYEALPTGALWIVTGSSEVDETRIRALGFFGLITGGNHHQAHHLMLAKGEMPH